MTPRVTPHPTSHPTPLAALGTVLSVWAHPDDETYLAAGVMATAADLGQRVVCAWATGGEHGTCDPDGWPPARLRRVRRWEAAAAMAVLGVHDHRMHDLPDGDLSAHEEEGVAWASRLLDDVEPDTILTFGPDGVTGHPDHVAVHRWVTAAWERRGRQARLLYAASRDEHLARFRDLYEEWGVYMTDERPVGVPAHLLALHLRLAPPLVDRKLTALRCLSSQTWELVTSTDPGVLAAELGEESFVDAILRS